MLTLSHFLLQLHFTTSETKVNYYHQKLNVQVASPVAKKPMELGNYRKTSKSADDFVPSLLSRNENLAIALENSVKSHYSYFYRKSYFT